MPKRVTSIVPISVKKVYSDHRQRKRFGVDAEDAKLWLESLETLRRNCGHKKVEKTEVEEKIENVETADNSGAFQAVFCPIGVDCKPILITENVTKIGSAEMCKIRLGNGCSCVSAIHAILFHDGLNRWEILNYSPFGLSVDGIHYGLEATEEIQDGPEISEKSEFIDRIHDIKGSLVFRENSTLGWKATKNTGNSESGDETEVPVKVKKIEKSNLKKSPKCGCVEPEPGWEASAPISHGSIISFGCYQFIFAVR